MAPDPRDHDHESAPDADAPIEYDVPVVRLRSARSAHLHPWVYRRQIQFPPERIDDGAQVALLSSDGQPLGRGFYHGRSTIAVRLLSADASRAIDRGFLRERLERALSLRRDVLRLARETDSFRWVHGEGDGLSGLIIDVYADLVVVQYHARGFFERRDLLVHVIEELMPGCRIAQHVDSASSRHEGMLFPGGRERAGGGAGDAEEVEIREGKMRFLVNTAGHKTGFFLDQRENRRRFAELVRGRKVLDAFCYTGGFASAAKTLGKADRVTAVDLDEAAIAQGKRNAHLNRAPIQWVHADCFDYLRRQQHAVEPFDAVVVDPPKWAVGRDRLDDAERRYVDINTYACRAVRPGGLLLTCSCSGLISEEKFLRTVAHAAGLAGRDLQIFRVAGAAADHPVSAHCPESRYLNAVFARVL